MSPNVTPIIAQALCSCIGCQEPNAQLHLDVLINAIDTQHYPHQDVSPLELLHISADEHVGPVKHKPFLDWIDSMEKYI